MAIQICFSFYPKDNDCMEILFKLLICQYEI